MGERAEEGPQDEGLGQHTGLGGLREVGDVFDDGESQRHPPGIHDAVHDAVDLTPA